MMSSLQKFVFHFVNSRGRDVIKTMIFTMCDDDKAVLTRVRIQRVILRTERFISEMPFFYFMMVKIALFLMQYAIPPLSWKIIPFTRMSLKRRIAYLEEWQSSNFYPKRIIFRLASSVCLSHLYSERRLLISLGFETSMQNRIAHQWSLTEQR